MREVKHLEDPYLLVELDTAHLWLWEDIKDDDLTALGDLDCLTAQVHRVFGGPCESLSLEHVLDGHVGPADWLLVPGVLILYPLLWWWEDGLWSLEFQDMWLTDGVYSSVAFR